MLCFVFKIAKWEKEKKKSTKSGNKEAEMK